MGYRTEIYRAQASDLLCAKPPPDSPVGSFCVPATIENWTARGWDVFDGLKAAEKAATKTNPADSSIMGLSYSLQNCHEAGHEKIMLRIDSWRHDKFGDTTDLQVMEIIFNAAQLNVPAKALESLKLMARPVRFTEKVASRTVSAALFLINQIHAGQVPDFERVLELHRIHPDFNKDPHKDSRTINGHQGLKKNGKIVRARTMPLTGPLRGSLTDARPLRRGFDGDRSGEG